MAGMESTTPVTPPITNRKIKASAHHIGIVYWMEPPHIVASHEKILIPVGTAITRVATMKYIFRSTSIPTVYM